MVSTTLVLGPEALPAGAAPPDDPKFLCVGESLITAATGGAGQVLSGSVVVAANSVVRVVANGEARTGAWSGIPGAGTGAEVVEHIGVWDASGAMLRNPNDIAAYQTIGRFPPGTPLAWHPWGPVTVYTFPTKSTDNSYSFSFKARFGHSGTDLWASARVDLVSGGRSAECRPVEPGELDVPNRSEPNACGAQPSAADPVNVVQGNFWESWEELTVPGRGPGLTGGRTYSSSRAATDGPLGHGWSFDYGMAVTVADDVARVAQENGALVPFTSRGSAWVPPRRVNATLVEDLGSTSARWVFTRGGREVFTFDSAGRLVSIADLSGNTTTLSYADGVLTSVTDASGRQLVFTWASGKITQVSAPPAVLATGGPAQPMEVSYGYTAGNLTSVTGPDGGVWTYGYDGSHRMTTVREPRHHSLGAAAPVVENHYDWQGRVERQDDRLDRQTTFAYAQDATTVTDAMGNVTLFEHTDGLCTAVVRNPGPDESRWDFEVDTATLGRTRVTDPNGIVTTATFNHRGLPTAVTTPQGRTEITYDSVTMMPTAVKDPLGVTTTHAYAPGTDRLTGVARPITPGGGTWSMALAYADPDHPGAPSSITDARGSVYAFDYNAAGDLVSASVPTTESTPPLVTTWTYSPHGWPLSSVAPAGNAAGGTPVDHTTWWEYNRAGDVVKVNDALGAVTDYGVDPSGHLQWMRDPVASGDPVEQTIVERNAAGELITVTRPDGSTLVSEYWPDGSLKTQRDAADAATSYAYDPQGRLSTITDPANRVTTFRYDAAGRVVSKQHPGGNCLATTKVGCITYSYLPSGELETIDYADPVTSDVTFGHDALGRRISMVDSAGTSTFTWDSIGRRLTAVDPVGGTVAYGYADHGPQATTVTYPGGKVVRRTFDAAGRQESATGWVGGTTRFGYDDNSNLTSVDTAAADGVEDTYGYDALNRMTASSLRQGISTLASLGFTRDPEGMVTATTGTGVAGADDSFGYTALDQLASDSTGTYEYDAADNLTGFPDGRRQRFNAANELCYQASTSAADCGSAPVDATAYGYDGRGNRTSRIDPSGDEWTYEYDQADRLASASLTPPGAGQYHDLVPQRILDTTAGSGIGVCTPSPCAKVQTNLNRPGFSGGLVIGS